MNTGLLVLAAGGSTRLGRPKQLLPDPKTGEALVTTMARTALASDLGPVLVVLGAEAEACHAALSAVAVRTIISPDWSAGMGSSIACGMKDTWSAELDAVLIVLCDQPHVSADALRRLHAHHCTSGAAITASRYLSGDTETLGPPAVFSAQMFPRLRELSGHTGAKALFRETTSLASWPMPEASFDVDTPQDAERWQRGVE